MAASEIHPPALLEDGTPVAPPVRDAPAVDPTAPTLPNEVLGAFHPEDSIGESETERAGLTPAAIDDAAVKRHVAASRRVRLQNAIPLWVFFLAGFGTALVGGGLVLALLSLA